MPFRNRFSLGKILLLWTVAAIVSVSYSVLQYASFDGTLGGVPQYYRPIGGAAKKTPRVSTGVQQRRLQKQSALSRQSRVVGIDYVAEEAQVQFQVLPEFVRGSIAGALLFTLLNSYPVLIFVGLLFACVYYMLVVHKADVASPSSRFNVASSKNEMFYRVGQTVAVLRSNETWTPARVAAFKEDGSIEVRFSAGGSNHAKIINKEGVSRYLRLLQPTSITEVAIKPSTGDIFAVRDQVEVLRTSGTWSRATVAHISENGTISVTINGTEKKKIVSQSKIAYIVRRVAEPENLVSVNITPGLLGMEIHHDTGTVLNVSPGSQAMDLGVKKDWIIFHVDGQPYSFELFYKHVGGQKPYALSFVH